MYADTVFSKMYVVKYYIFFYSTVELFRAYAVCLDFADKESARKTLFQV